MQRGKDGYVCLRGTGSSLRIQKHACLLTVDVVSATPAALCEIRTALVTERIFFRQCAYINARLAIRSARGFNVVDRSRGDKNKLVKNTLM